MSYCARHPLGCDLAEPHRPRRPAGAHRAGDRIALAGRATPTRDRAAAWADAFTAVAATLVIADVLDYLDPAPRPRPRPAPDPELAVAARSPFEAWMRGDDAAEPTDLDPAYGTPAAHLEVPEQWWHTIGA